MTLSISTLKSGFMLASISRSYSISVIAILCWTALVLFPSTSATWVFNDDYQQFAENPAVSEPGRWMDFITHNTGEMLSPAKKSSIYRPLYLISYKIESLTWGLSPFITRLINLGLHITTAILMFLFLHRFTSTMFAFGATLFFSIHPTIVEPASWASGRHELIFGLCTLIMIHSLQSRKYAWIGPLILIGGLTKETFLPVSASLLCVYTLFSFLRHKKNFLPSMDRRKVFSIVAVLSCFCVVVYLRFMALDGASFGLPTIAIFFRNLTFTTSRYAEVLFQPWKIGVFMADVQQPITLLRFLGLALATACLGLCFLNRTSLVLKSLLLTTFFVPIFTVSLIADLAGHVHDRYFYVSHMALCMLVAVSIPREKLQDRRAHFFGLAFLSLLICLSYLSFVRCKIWQTYPKMIHALLKQSPENPQVHLEAAQYSLRVNDQHQAKVHLQNLIHQSPKNIWAHNVLAVLHIYGGDLAYALPHLKEAYVLAPENHQTNFNLGFYFETKGDLKKAKDWYSQALGLHPDNQKTRDALSRIELSSR